jgi:hypothetical protein
MTIDYTTTPDITVTIEITPNPNDNSIAFVLPEYRNIFMRHYLPDGTMV